MAASILVVNPAPVDDRVSVGAYCNGTEPLTFEQQSIEGFVATVGKNSSIVPLEVSKSDTIASVNLFTQAHRTVNGDSIVYKVWPTENSKDVHKFNIDNEGIIPLDVPVATLNGAQLQDSSIQEISLKGKSVLYLRVHRPKVRSTYLGRKEVELVVTSDDTVCQNPVASSDVVSQTESLDFKVVREGQKLQQLKHSFQQPARLLLPPRCPISFDLPNSLKELIDHVKMGLLAGQVPCLTAEGSGGVYLMKDEYGMQNIAVFKPMDEEPMCVNNPRGYSTSNHGEGLKKGTRSGEGAIREVAAYVLDHVAGGRRSRTREDVAKKVVEGFSGVPPTTMVRCYNKAFHYGSHELPKAKAGALQQFVHAISSCEDMGSSKFPVDEVHKITILDLRLANTDRNGGNILACKEEDGQLKLVPIDHGYCLPDKFEDCSFEWLYWAQAQKPYSPAALEYISSLDAEEDIKLLQHCGWSLGPRIARNFRISTMLLKKGAAAGLTPFEIGSIMCRTESLDSKSPIELILEKVEAKNIREHAFLKVVSDHLDEYITMLKC